MRADGTDRGVGRTMNAKWRGVGVWNVTGRTVHSHRCCCCRNWKRYDGRVGRAAGRAVRRRGLHCEPVGRSACFIWQSVIDIGLITSLKLRRKLIKWVSINDVIVIAASARSAAAAASGSVIPASFKSYPHCSPWIAFRTHVDMTFLPKTGHTQAQYWAL